MESNNINETLGLTTKDENNKQNIEENKYPAIKTIIKIIKVFAIILGIISFIAALVANDYSGFVSISIIAGGLTIILLLVGVAEFFKIMIDIEFNTRNK
jgi:2-iminoacetate synthase ThiH